MAAHDLDPPRRQVYFIGGPQNGESWDEPSYADYGKSRYLVVPQMDGGLSSRSFPTFTQSTYRLVKHNDGYNYYGFYEPDL